MNSSFVEGYVEEPALAQVGQKAIIANDAGQFLILRRSAQSSRAGGWDFAGGRIELGEDPTAAILREIFEETGLVINDVTPIDVGSYSNDKTGFVVIICYLAKTLSKDIHLSWEHDYYEWMSKEQVAKINLPPLHRRFFEHAISTR